MTTTKFGLAQPVRRVEDPRLLKGAGRYTDDIVLPGMLFGVVLRSPHAAAKITAWTPPAAQALPGVPRVYTAADLEADGIGATALRRAGQQPRRLTAGRAAASGAGRGRGAPCRRSGCLHRRRHHQAGARRRRSDRRSITTSCRPSPTSPTAMDAGATAGLARGRATTSPSTGRSATRRPPRRNSPRRRT